MWWLIGDLAFLSPVELFFAFSWLSYNYPNSVFRRLYLKLGSIFGFIAMLFIFGFFWSDIQHYLHWGIPMNTSDGLYSQITRYDTTYELNSEKSYYDNWRGNSGYDMSIHIQTNTNNDVSMVEISIEEYECMNEPKSIFGVSDEDNCVWNNRHEEIEYKYEVKNHSSEDFTIKTQMDPSNMSSGKYPYMYYQARVTGYSIVHHYTPGHEEYNPNLPEYMR